MSAISTYLQKILNAIWAKDVRQAIHDAISQCYDDVNAPALQTEAMQAAVQAKIDAGEMAALTIADGSLTGAKLANGTIPTAKIADGAVTTGKIADGAVTGAKVGTGTLTGDNIANKAIGTAKIDDSAVTWQKLANEAVHTAEIADGAVTSAKLGNASVAIEKLSPDVRNAIENASGLSDDAKVALLNCFAHVAWTDAEGQSYYNALNLALYEDVYPRIVAVFDAGTNTIYTDDPLESLTEYMTVKYYAAKGDAGVTIPPTEYTLSGVLKSGKSIINVIYDNLSTVVTIGDVVDFYNIWNWSLADNGLVKLNASVDTNQSDTTKYPSRMLILLNYDVRRNFSTVHGKAPYYLKNNNAIASQYYPIPIPKTANHVKITMEPANQYVNINTCPYDEANGYYLNDVAENRSNGWEQLATGIYEKDIVQSELGQLFMKINTKYDSAGTSYPVEPTSITIEFNEV